MTFDVLLLLTSRQCNNYFNMALGASVTRSHSQLYLYGCIMELLIKKFSKSARSLVNYSYQVIILMLLEDDSLQWTPYMSQKAPANHIYFTFIYRETYEIIVRWATFEYVDDPQVV